MSDYERYGEYNQGDEDRGPARPKPWKIILSILKFAAICLLAGVCGVLGFRMCAAEYYPKSMKRIHYTDALTAYAADKNIYAETQSIRVPFGDEWLFAGDDGRLQRSDVRLDFYRADNLIVVRDAGHLQLSIRINKRDIKNIAEKYGLGDFKFSEDAFTFLLYDNRNLVNEKLQIGGGGVYTPTDIEVDDALMYYYIKVCFDGIDFDDVKWMRLDITPKGTDTAKEDYKQLGICVYENNDDYDTFKQYKLKKSEKLS